MAVQYQPIPAQDSAGAIADGDLIPTFRPPPADNPIPLPQSAADLADYVQPYELRRLSIDGYAVLADSAPLTAAGQIALRHEDPGGAGTGQIALRPRAADLKKLQQSAFSAGHQIEVVKGGTVWSIVITLSVSQQGGLWWIINFADADTAWPYDTPDTVNLRGASPHIPWTSLVQAVRALAQASRLAVPSERAVRQAITAALNDAAAPLWDGYWVSAGGAEPAATTSSWGPRDSARAKLTGDVTASAIAYLRFNRIQSAADGVQDGTDVGTELAGMREGGLARLTERTGGAVFTFRLTGDAQPRESDGSAPESGDAVTAYDMPVELVSPDGTLDYTDTFDAEFNPRNELVAERDVVRETPVVGALADGANIAWAVDELPNARVTLGGNRTMSAPTGAVDGAYYLLTVKQDGAGSRTLTWDAAYVFDAVQNTIVPGASKRTKFTFVYEDGKMRALSAARGF